MNKGITVRILLPLCIAAFLSLPLQAATYYVKNAGDDAHTGLSDGQAWKTITNVNAQSFSPGDAVLFNRGDVWRETLLPPSDGITVGAYGSGDLPLISAAEPVTNLVAVGSNGVEQTGSIADIDHASGDVSEWSTVIDQGACAAAYSTDQARSFAGSLKLTGDSADNRAYGRITFSAVTNGSTIHVFFALYTPSGQFKADSELKQTIGANKVFIKLFTDASGAFDEIEMSDYGVTGSNDSKITALLSNWSMDAWNIVELSYQIDDTTGGAELWVNGEKIDDNGYTFDTSSLSVEKVEVGNNAYGAGPISNGYFYVDDVKVSTNACMAERYAVGNPNLWTAVFPTHPVQVFVNDVRGQRMSNAVEVTSYRQWHWDSVSTTLTVHGAASAEPDVEATVRSDCINMNGRRDMTIENLRLERGGWFGIRADSIDQCAIQDCEIAGCYINGIRSSDTTLRTNVYIRRNTVSDCGGMGIGFGGRLDQWFIEDNEVMGCGILTVGVAEYGDGREAAFGWTGGIKIWGWGGDGWVGYYAIRNNTVGDSIPVSWAPSPASTHGHGIWCDEVLKPTARPEIYGNIVKDCYSRGVYLEKCDDHDAFRNVIYGCGQVQYTAGLEAQSNPYGYDVILDQPDNNAPRQVGGNRLFHNTSVGGWWSLSVSCSSPNCAISNTVVRDNICVGANGGSASLYLHGGGANNGTHGTGNTYINNCFGPEGGGWVWGSTPYNSYAAFEAASGGAVTNSVQGNPVFMNPGAENYRLDTSSPCIGTASDGRDVGAYDSDRDGDGMPDWWENRHGGGWTNLDAHADSDNDDLTDFEEYIANCVPTNGQSVLCIDLIQPDLSGSNFVVTWQSASNRIYGVSWLTNLLNGNREPLASNLSAHPPQNTWTDRTHGLAQIGYYLIDVRIDD